MLTLPKHNSIITRFIPRWKTDIIFKIILLTVPHSEYPHSRGYLNVKKRYNYYAIFCTSNWKFVLHSWAHPPHCLGCHSNSPILGHKLRLILLASPLNDMLFLMSLSFVSKISCGAKPALKWLRLSTPLTVCSQSVGQKSCQTWRGTAQLLHSLCDTEQDRNAQYDSVIECVFFSLALNSIECRKLIFF